MDEAKQKRIDELITKINTMILDEIESVYTFITTHSEIQISNEGDKRIFVDFSLFDINNN